MTPLQRAYRWIAQRAHSENEIRRKLSRYADETEIEETVGRLRQLKLLDDLDFSSAVASYRLKEKHQGPGRILQELEARQVPESVRLKAMRQALEETPEIESAEKALQNYLARRRRPENVPETYRLIQYLNRMGFSEEAIQSVLKKQQIHFDF